jgi:PrtD family type I secretion system ABC transporter
MRENSGLRAVIARGVLEVGIFSAVINVLLFVMPLYMMQVYDRVLPSASIDTLLYLSIFAVLALGFLGIIEAVRSIYCQRVAASIDQKVASQAFMASLSGARAEAGDIQPLRDLGTVRGFIASRGVATLFDLPFGPLFLALLLLIHPLLFWVTIAGAVVMILLVLLNQLSNKKFNDAAMEKSALANLAAQAFARNADTLRAMGMKRNAAEVWGRVFAESIGVQDRSASISALFSGISRSTRMMLQLAILGVGAWLVLKGEMTGGMIFATSTISGRALQPLDQLIGGWRQTIDARKAWKRLESSLQASKGDFADKVELPTPKGAIAAKNLTYLPPGFPPGAEAIIKGLNFSIAPGESIAIVGPSKAGKSTLARLLVGAVKPNNGTVQVDGADLRTWNENQLGKYIGYLAQDVQLLPGTIAQNVSRFDIEPDHNEIISAAQRAQAHEVILTQRDGYQTRIGVGSVLSGGERQRIGLARAFYGNPKILVLDEPNSNLDSEGEASLEQALSLARASGTTAIIITHRLSIAATCDRVLVLRDGIVEAFGASADILRQVASPRGNPVPPQNLATPARHSGVTAFGTGTQASGRWGTPLKPRGS